MQDLWPLYSDRINTIFLDYSTLKYRLLDMTFALALIIAILVAEDGNIHLIFVIHLAFFESFQANEVIGVNFLLQLHQSVIILNRFSLRRGFIIRRCVDALDFVRIWHCAAWADVNLETFPVDLNSIQEKIVSAREYQILRNE